MAINRTNLGATPIQQSFDSVIEIRTTRPNVNDVLDPPDTPGRLIGYYNGASGFVELYVVSSSGTSLLRI